MKRTTKIGAGVATGAAALLAATALAAAASPRTSDATDDATPSPSSSSAPSDSGQKGSGGRGSGETPLTGTDAEKATAAAEAAVEGGTILRVETDNDGVYEAHVRKSDGTEVVVKMDKDFNVTGVEEFTGRGGRGGHGGGGSGETPLTGTDAEKATAAAEAAVEGGTILRVETDNDGVYEAHVRKSDGTEVVVKMDKDFNVTGVEEFTGHGGRGGHGGSGSTNSQDDTATATPSTSA